MNNTRFSIALHIMTLLALNSEEWLSSEFIASSINVNAVVVRREIASLKAAGLLESKKGKEGGCTLARPISRIRLSDIYVAIKQSDLLGKKILQPNPKCPVGKNINKNLGLLFDAADERMISFLHGRSLKDFAGSFA